MYCGFPTVSDKVFDRVKQESRGPIIGRCPLSLAGKLKYISGNLDDDNAHIVLDTLRQFAHGGAVLLVTHDQRTAHLAQQYIGENAAEHIARWMLAPV
jgi:hypothetical protein